MVKTYLYSILMLACLFSACTNDRTNANTTPPATTPVVDTNKNATVTTKDTVTATPPAAPEPSAPATKNSEPKSAPSGGPKISFDQSTYGFGTIQQGEKVVHAFTFTNTGNGPLEIKEASASCGCTIPEYPFIPIPPGGTGTIKVTFNSANKAGAVRPTVTVTSNAYPHTVKLYLDGVVDGPREEIKVSKTPF